VTPPLSLLPLTLKVALPPSLEVIQSLLPLYVVPPSSLRVSLHTLELLPCLLPQDLMDQLMYQDCYNCSL
jgi:hypothetical protein